MASTFAYCLEESLRGQHHLFDFQQVRRFLTEPFEPDAAAIADARRLFREIQAAESLQSQRSRLRQAPERAQRLFVRLYFDFLAQVPKARH